LPGRVKHRGLSSLDTPGCLDQDHADYHHGGYRNGQHDESYRCRGPVVSLVSREDANHAQQEEERRRDRDTDKDPPRYPLAPACARLRFCPRHDRVPSI